MLDHLIRIGLVERMSGKELPEEDCWVDEVKWDILTTMMAYIDSAPPQVKALTFRPVNARLDDPLREACKKKGITVVWARPPDFVRYLDGDG